MGDVKLLSEKDIRLLRDRLSEAAGVGRVDDVSQLSITHFAGDVDTLGEALNTACEYGQLDVVRWLVEHTVLCNNGERLGKALVEACKYNGQWNIVKYLVTNAQLDINYSDTDSANSILHRVISFNAVNLKLLNTRFLGITALCRLVYVYYEDVNEQDNSGYTPLHRACDHSQQLQCRRFTVSWS
jgi:ankyrin repeat protein